MKNSKSKHKECLRECEYDTNKTAFLIVAIIFSVVYLFSMLILVGKVRERASSFIGLETNFSAKLL